MFRVLRAVAVVAGTLVAFATAPASAASIVLAARTHLVLVPSRAFLASDVAVGQSFDLRLEDPIIVGGFVAIPDGARARAHVVAKTPALRIVFDWVRTRGKTIALDRTPYAVRATGNDGRRRSFFFGLIRKKSEDVGRVSRDSPLEATTARRVRIATRVRATRAQRNSALRTLLE